MLIAIDQLLPPDALQQFQQQLQQADWQDGGLSAGSLARQAKHNQQLDEADPLARALGEQLLRRLGQQPQFISAALPRRIYPPRFNRYTGGGHYGTHVDSAVMVVPGNPLTLRSDLSATLFLSDPGDYDGGELEIETAFGVQSVKLDAGDLVLYPSSSLHCVKPVTRGSRLASFFWVESLVADEGERSLLYDLDQAIQALTPSVPQQQRELLKLTGIYHNLLRRWAIT